MTKMSAFKSISRKKHTLCLDEPPSIQEIENFQQAIRASQTKLARMVAILTLHGIVSLLLMIIIGYDQDIEYKITGCLIVVSSSLWVAFFYLMFFMDIFVVVSGGSETPIRQGWAKLNNTLLKTLLLRHDNNESVHHYLNGIKRQGRVALNVELNHLFRLAEKDDEQALIENTFGIGEIKLKHKKGTPKHPLNC